jgi:hypothetical protein
MRPFWRVVEAALIVLALGVALWAGEKLRHPPPELVPETPATVRCVCPEPAQ